MMGLERSSPAILRPIARGVTKREGYRLQASRQQAKSGKEERLSVFWTTPRSAPLRAWHSKVRLVA